jgi:NADH-quinone oxidoreductase subunit E
VQREKGFVNEASALGIAEELAIPLIWVREAISWYTMIHEKPVGRHHLQLCRNLSCALMGSEELLAQLTQKLNIAVGETSADGKFTLDVAECLGSCGTAPVMQVNERYHECLNAANLNNLIDELKND